VRVYSRAFNLYKRAVCLLGLAVLVGTLTSGGPVVKDPIELGIFLLVIFLAEILPVKLPGTFSETTMTMPAVLGLFISQGPAAAIIMTPISMAAADLIVHRGHGTRWLIDMALHNAGVCILSLATASFTYTLAGGKTLAHYAGGTPSDMILPLLLWVFACSTMNALLFTVGVSLCTSEPWRVLAVQHLRWFVPNYLITGPSGILFAYLYLQYGITGILLVIVPFLVGRQALNQYAVQVTAYRETITTLGSYMQHYHAYTKGHLERVAALADKIAKYMGLPLQSLMFIRDAGLLHDIGKVGVNDEVLDKVGALTETDWALIKQHPARGAEILAQMKHLERIVPWVRGHHERPDGRGYPDGLQDGEIPLEAAVLAVADAFDAMSGGSDDKDKRVYRAPLTLDQAVDQVRYGAGTQFDPRVVGAFMRVMAREEMESGG